MEAMELWTVTSREKGIYTFYTLLAERILSRNEFRIVALGSCDSSEIKSRIRDAKPFLDRRLDMIAHDALSLMQLRARAKDARLRFAFPRSR